MFPAGGVLAVGGFLSGEESEWPAAGRDALVELRRRRWPIALGVRIKEGGEWLRVQGESPRSADLLDGVGRLSRLVGTVLRRGTVRVQVQVDGKWGAFVGGSWFLT